MTGSLSITGGKVYDPANGADGLVCDVHIEDGRVVESPSPASRSPDVAAPTIDAAGLIVMPGGVDMHAHIASMTINTARQVQQQAASKVVPTAPQTGELYLKLGYTTVIEPAVAPTDAGLAHMQLDDVPGIETGLLTVMGNHEALIDCIDRGDHDAAVGVVQHLLHVTKSLGIKAVNPIGVAAWRRDAGKRRIDSIDDCAAGTNVSPRTMLELLCGAQAQLGLAHATHIHGPQLGEPGSIDITLAMIDALAGRRMHLAHLQYYAYGRTKRCGHKSAADRLVAKLADRPDVTADLGLVAFGPAVTATSDLPLEYELHRRLGQPAAFCETGNEDGFGVMPITRSADHPIHAVQWAAGLELALLTDNPWQFALSVDHPNGGSFLNYPHLIALLMNKPLRDEQLTAAHRHATDRTGLSSIDRELSLREIAIMTRDAPAQALGLSTKGHLGPGADGDVTIYRDDTADPQRMFAQPRYVIKAGRVVVDDGRLVVAPPPPRLCAAAGPNEKGERLLSTWYDTHGSYDFRHVSMRA